MPDLLHRLAAHAVDPREPTAIDDALAALLRIRDAAQRIAARGDVSEGEARWILREFER